MNIHLGLAPVVSLVAGILILAMPRLAMKPAPARAPPMRAESRVVREMPIVATRCACGTLALTAAVHRPRSDGLISPTK